MEDPKSLTMFIDGAARGNPGPAAIGVVIYDGSKNLVKKMHKFIGNSTNNVAEYMALLYGLQEAALLGAKEIVVNTDSELLAKQMNKQYKVKDQDLRYFYILARHIADSIGKVEIKKIDREKNKDADILANEAIESLF